MFCPATANHATGEDASGSAETPRVQIVLLRQCVCVSGSGPETHTLTLFLVSGLTRRRRGARRQKQARWWPIPDLPWASADTVKRTGTEAGATQSLRGARLSAGSFPLLFD